ncbi:MULTISPECIES: growth/differentiation factor [Mycolicibacterium]|uniref:growth/differentiation factor n=1 Tax=Mycolicibacterium TaxID=1866885 RepID=UPI001E447165|nr:growth/differentiation factor [Mycolicibacterium mageritense]MBN3457857.1 growth/differentiation factor [Mycobacterium sp. DSM 3803]GJJ18715.1 hypothetical protein MTY414_23880 [Mycolicibacterium mageritense]
MDFSVLSTAVDAVVAASLQASSSSSSSDDGSWIPLLFLLTGPAFFMYQYTRYRNKNKRHHHETETLSDIANLRVLDQRVDSVSNSRNSRMSGANEREVRG